MNKLIETMDKIEYGFLDVNGDKHLGTLEGFVDLYRLQSPKSVLENKVGVCWDQVELERYLLDEEQIEHWTFFIVQYTDNICPTHTFIIYKDKENGKYVWFEHSWESMRGVYTYDSLEEALKDVKSKYIEDQLKDAYDEDRLVIYEYEKVEPGTSVKGFFEHCEKGKKIDL